MTDIPKFSTLTPKQIMTGEKHGWSDVYGDPLNEVLTELTDEMSELAKDRLRQLHDLPPEEPKPLPPLAKDGILHQAKTAEELGFTDADLVPLTDAEKKV